jgi:serine phosphatase RsbU (regulator of sigma subunit)/pSer/pThr/pTyr-binding forkhead associated (FHA) protein
MDFLTVVGPDGASSRYTIETEDVRVGRASTSDLVLADLNVSRLHARLQRSGDAVYVMDAGGKNGTYVNGQRIAEAQTLRRGDRIRVGSTTLIFNDTGSTVEFGDRPLAGGGETTILRAAALSTPSTDDSGEGSQSGILAAANEQLVFHRPLPELLDTIMDLARRAVPFERGVLMLLDEEGRLRPEVIRVPPAEAGQPVSISRTVTDRVVKMKESVLTSDALLDDRFKEGHSVAAQHIRSVMCVPLWNNREVIGVLYVDNLHWAGLFGEANLRLLAQLANVAAVKIENNRLFQQALAAQSLEKELRRAAEIQRRLLPAEEVSIPGYRVFGRSVPCRAVGGDYFDYLDQAAGRRGFALGDVAGKGLPAALTMCALQASLHALADLSLSPADLMVRLNVLVKRHIPENRFVTFFWGVIDLQDHALAYVNGGHNPPILLRASGEAETLAITGAPLGVLDDARFETGRTTLGPGDLLVGYSDGVTEETGPGEEEFGEARLLQIVREARDRPPAVIGQRILDALDQYCAGGVRRDDTTLLILQRLS